LKRKLERVSGLIKKKKKKSQPKKKVYHGEIDGMILLLLATQYDHKSTISKVPMDVIKYIFYFYVLFLDPMKHIVVHSCESEYSAFWGKNNTLNFVDPQAGWFSAQGHDSSWIVFDLVHCCYIRQFSLTINSNGVKKGVFEISKYPEGPWHACTHFTTPPQDSLPRQYVIIPLDYYVITRYIRINCLESHGTPNGFYKIKFE